MIYIIHHHWLFLTGAAKNTAILLEAWPTYFLTAFLYKIPKAKSFGTPGLGKKKHKKEKRKHY